MTTKSLVALALSAACTAACIGGDGEESPSPQPTNQLEVDLAVAAGEDIVISEWFDGPSVSVVFPPELEARRSLSVFAAEVEEIYAENVVVLQSSTGRVTARNISRLLAEGLTSADVLMDVSPRYDRTVFFTKERPVGNEDVLHPGRLIISKPLTLKIAFTEQAIAARSPEILATDIGVAGPLGDTSITSPPGSFIGSILSVDATGATLEQMKSFGSVFSTMTLYDISEGLKNEYIEWLRSEQSSALVRLCDLDYSDSESCAVLYPR